MQDPFFGPTASALGFGAFAFTILLLVITLWSLVWKALALWHAARNRQRIWFVVLLVLNTVGILEIIYLAWFRKDTNNGKSALFPFLSSYIAKVEEKVAESSSAPTEETKVVKDEGAV